ncbi:sugar phosphate isomerase/epimerase family protein [Butyrivibrio sp. MC2013]|uniref:sugar phosphate isomerase/epimerase family protein n=1 Tax=Butyrivibrio sp. MC2013 TaxID=1280686 RepID=UPI0004102580|nr:TIM barrel protein [Butyrivibrio sp. MC2013]
MLEDSVITGFADEIAPALDLQVELLHKLGISMIELRGANGKGFVDHSLQEARAVWDYLREHDMGVSVLASPIGKIDIREDTGGHMELLRYAAELAHLVETPYIRVFSFYIPQDQDAEIYREEVLERVGRMKELAEQSDVILLHENEKGIYGDNAARCLELMEHFYGEHFKAVFDFANFVQCHQDTLEAYDMLSPYIAHVHIKDALFKDGSVTPAGMGDGHIREILTGLEAAGYKGYLSLEPHLTDFAGFAGLEAGVRQLLDKGEAAADPENAAAREDKRRLRGDEAFTLAYKALIDLLEQL